MNDNEWILITLISAVIFWIILYFVIKSAVKHGILDARDHVKRSKNIQPQQSSVLSDSSWTPKQYDLYHKYSNGKITTKEYKEEWNKP